MGGEGRAELEDPALYVTADGAARAATIGGMLESAKAELERAFAAWEAATEALEATG